MYPVATTFIYKEAISYSELQDKSSKLKFIRRIMLLQSLLVHLFFPSPFTSTTNGGLRVELISTKAFFAVYMFDILAG